MHDPTKELISEEEYIRREREADYKSEFLNGEVFAMAGGKPKHNLVAGNVMGAVRQLLRGKRCAVLTSDQRIQVQPSGLYTYADAVVVCDRPRFDPKYEENLLNPMVIVEVLSPSTETYDRGAKFEHYRTLDSLREYVLVAPHKTRIEHYAKQDDGQWVLNVFESLDATVPFPALGIAVPVAEIYENVDMFRNDDEPLPRPPRPKVLG